MSIDDAAVPAGERGERDRLGRGERQVTAGAVVDLPLSDPSPDALPEAVRHFAPSTWLKVSGSTEPSRPSPVAPRPAHALPKRCYTESFAQSPSRS